MLHICSPLDGSTEANFSLFSKRFFVASPTHCLIPQESGIAGAGRAAQLLLINWDTIGQQITQLTKHCSVFKQAEKTGFS